MKITIELTEAEVNGIKAYLKSVDNNEKPIKEDIKGEVQGIVSSYLQSPHCAISDYIKKHSK
jgi:hypothetical protein